MELELYVVAIESKISEVVDNGEKAQAIFYQVSLICNVDSTKLADLITKTNQHILQVSTK